MNRPEKLYEFHMPGATIIGPGAHRQIPARLKTLNITHPLLVTDKGMTENGLAGQIMEQLAEAGFTTTLFDKTVPNPTDANVHNGAEVYHARSCDGLVSLGGGSSHDCAKGIGLVVSGGGRIQDYEGENKASANLPPYMAISTTAGTASEMTRITVITDLIRKVKMYIADDRITPRVAIVDPILMKGMPPSLTAATGMDALSHAVEAYVSTARHPLTDACAEKAIHLIFEYLPQAVANGDNLEARAAMAQAQYLAGMAFNSAGLGYVHALSHQLGGFYNLPHGECNAIILPVVESFNLIACQKRLARLAWLMGEEVHGLSERQAAETAIRAMRRLALDVGLPDNLAALGRRYGRKLNKGDIPLLAEQALKEYVARTNPRRGTESQLTTLFELAFGDD